MRKTLLSTPGSSFTLCSQSQAWEPASVVSALPGLCPRGVLEGACKPGVKRASLLPGPPMNVTPGTLPDCFPFLVTS